MRLDLGANKMIKQLTGKYLSQIEAEEYADPDTLSAVVYACARRGFEVDREKGLDREEITMSDVDALQYKEINGEISQAIHQMVRDFMPDVPEPADSAEGDVPLEENRQS